MHHSLNADSSDVAICVTLAAAWNGNAVKSARRGDFPFD
jgi:hypothetical protein